MAATLTQMLLQVRRQAPGASRPVCPLSWLVAPRGPQGGGRNSHQLTMEMSAVTVPLLLGDLLLRPAATGGAVAGVGAGARILHGWTPWALVPVCVQAAGGVVVGLVTKYLGGIKKGFAIVGGLAFTGVLQALRQGQMLPARLLAALVMVVIRRVCPHTSRRSLARCGLMRHARAARARSTWLHAAFPWQPPKRKQ